MLKKYFTALFVLAALCLSPLFAAGGLLTGEKDLRVVQTEWFDIIYPARCEKTASILFQTADTIYAEVTSQYGRDPCVRFPVVITPATQQLNAFYTPVYYNRIVLFDTSASEFDELSESFSQGFLSVFRHELTHAVTYNLKNGFWNAVTKVFGDPAVLGYVFLSSGMAEGATVTSESAAGEGRLNNEFFKHRVKQAKLEGQFPNYFDVQGASDAYPSGAFYDFNAAFHQWLQKNYGMEKYADFWYTLINTKSLGVANSFKKAYGINLNVAWKEFQEAYEVPDIPANPVQAGLVKDFFIPTAKTYSARNRFGARYSDLSVAETGITWVESSSNTVHFLSKENFDYPQGEKLLFALRGLNGAKISPDGKYLAVSYYTGLKPNITAGIKIFNMETKRFFDSGIEGLKDAAIIKSGEKYYLAGQRYETPYNYIEVYELIINDEKIAGLSKTASVQQPLYTFSGSFIACGEGKVAYLQNNKLKYSIRVCDVKGKELAAYELPEGMYAAHLSYSQEEAAVYYNWASKGTTVRAARLYLDSGKTEYSSLELSGGIFYPVSDGDDIVYTGRFYRQNRMFRLSKSDAFENVKLAEAESIPAEVIIPSVVLDMELNPDLPLDSERYNPLKYIARGLFIPYSSYVSEAFGENFGVQGANYALPLGVTYVTGNPWSSGTDGVVQVTAGYGLNTMSFGAAISAQDGTATDLFAYRTNAGSEFDEKGWKQSVADLQLSSAIPVGHISYISFSNSLSGKIGRQNEALPDWQTIFSEMDEENTTLYVVGMAKPASDTVSYHVGGSLSASYSNIMSAGPGRFDLLGFSLVTGVAYLKDASIEEKPQTYQDSFSLIGAFKGYIPQLLPVKSEYGYIYHLPAKMEVFLFPSKSNYGYANASAQSFGIPVIDANIETVLFGMDVQKAVPFFTPIFIHDFYVTAGYSGAVSTYTATQQGFQILYLGEYFDGLKDGSALYQDSVFLKFALEINPNIGATANSNFKMSLAGGMKYSFHQLEKPDKKLGAFVQVNTSF